MVRTVISVLLLSGVLAPPAQKPAAVDLLERVCGCWVETSRTDSGRAVIGDKLIGHQFGADATATWETSGETTLAGCKGGVTIGATTEPMRLDLHNHAADGKRYVVPCIFKFDGDRLILAMPDRAGLPLPARASGEYPERPTGFTSTKENRYSVAILEPTELYGTRPVKKR